MVSIFAFACKTFRMLTEPQSKIGSGGTATFRKRRMLLEATRVAQNAISNPSRVAIKIGEREGRQRFDLQFFVSAASTGG